jgi:uncharacterized small protein (DUF1192 family)
MALHDEEEGAVPRPRSRLEKPPLDPLGVAELEAYVGELRAEIARAEAEIARKRSHRSAADSLFRGPGSSS